jgi:uncharacterized membrane protein YdbT with pleckstrin-like domain
MPEETLYKEHPAMFRNHPVLFVLCAILCVVVIGIPILVAWKLATANTTLTVTDERTRLRRGILSKNTNDVRHSDVRNVKVSQRMMQRLFGVGSVGISSSGQADMEIVVSGIRAPEKVRDLIDEHRHRAA